MNKTELRRLLAIPALAFMLAASERPAAAIQCSGWTPFHDCGMVYSDAGFFGCTNEPDTWAGMGLIVYGYPSSYCS